MSAIQTLAQEVPAHGAEIVDGTRNNAMLLAGKSAAGAVGGAAAGGAIGGIKGFTLPVIGLTAAVSAAITQIEHQRHMKRVAKFYKDEFAAKLGKDPKQIGANDLDVMSRGSILKEVAPNSIMSEELAQSRRRRNLGVALSMVASVVTIAVLGLALPGAEQAVQGALSGWGKEVAKGIVGLAVYHAVKAPMYWLGDKILGTDKQTTHERIADIQKERKLGKQIGKEQVFGVLVAARPDLDQVIKNRFRKSYDDLSIQDKQRLTHNMGQHMGVEAITNAINDGTMHVAELAFVAVGQTSGAPAPDAVTEEKKGVIGKVKEKLHDMVTGPKEEEKPARSFADRVARRQQADMTHLERLEASRTTGPLTER